MPAVSDRRSPAPGLSVSTRRRFLQGTALLTLGTLGLLASRTPPAVGAAKRKLTMLDWNHFVPIYEERLSYAFEVTESLNNPLLKNFEKHPYWDKVRSSPRFAPTTRTGT